jgi:hypothetical protein
MFASKFSDRPFGNGLTINLHIVDLGEIDGGQTKMFIKAVTR